jgi:DNA-binding winged helix-turn-helix (wHTH) protein/TolB-like protein/Flp pilus assembly protein TadD
MAETETEETVTTIGAWRLSAARNLLTGAQGEVRLEPRQVDLLLFLARHRGEVIGADRIIETVWQGQVVTDQSVYQAIARLRRALDDDAGHPRYIETVPKRGYRLIADVSFGATEPAAAPQSASPSRPRSLRIQRHHRAWLAGALLLLAGVAGFVLRSGADQPPIVLVLPFEALTDDPRDALVGEGFAIELAHMIGRSGRVRVIGPASTRLLAASPALDATTIAADLVVNGSLRSSSDGYRVAANLVDAASGVQLWSKVFDSGVEGVLPAQQRVASALADALNQSLPPGLAGPEAAQRVNGIGVYDDYLLGRYYGSLRSSADLERAIVHFSRALARDSDYLPALRGIASAYLLSSFYGTLPLADAIAAATGHLQQAAALAADDPEVLALFGLMDYLQGSYGQAADYLARAVALHPNLGEGWMWLGLALRQQGRLADALPAFRRASELEPLLVTSAVNLAQALAAGGAGDAGLRMLVELAARAHDGFGNRDQLYRAISGLFRDRGRLDEAHAWAQRALDLSPDSSLSLANLATVNALLGRRALANELAVQALGPSSVGRATADYLARLDVVMPGLFPNGSLMNEGGLHTRAGQPEIDWRRARLYAGMRAYLAKDYPGAADHLLAAFEGRGYPVSRVDQDLYACVSLADALGHSGRQPEALRQRRSAPPAP